MWRLPNSQFQQNILYAAAQYYSLLTASTWKERFTAEIAGRQSDSARGDLSREDVREIIS